MTWFQFSVLAFLLLVLLLTFAAVVRGWASRREGIVWSVISLAAAVAVVRPDEVTGPIARAMGIGRGADLVSYCAVVCMMVGFWMIYIRLRHLRRQVTLLVRQLALMEAAKGQGRN